jgi:hypothetical protein
LIAYLIGELHLLESDVQRGVRDGIGERVALEIGIESIDVKHPVKFVAVQFEEAEIGLRGRDRRSDSQERGDARPEHPDVAIGEKAIAFGID